MIVEFLGVSGVGKSYIATQYCHHLEDKGISYVWPWKGIYSKGYIRRNLQKFFAVVWKTATSPKWCCRLLRYLHQQDINGKRDLPVLFFNGIYLQHALEKYSGIDRVALFDEGVAQYVWAIHFRNRNNNISDEEIGVIGRLFNLPQILYVVTADIEIVLKRMVLRNVRDEIRERGDVLTELTNGQKMVEMVSRTLSSKMGVDVIFIDNSEEAS